ncbi:MAG: YigZ family protein [Oscillospiraceae bacterium]|nr:YigZ family protein [Oscillospiraceae bacterium]
MKTPANDGEFTLVVKRSKFIGVVFRVETEDDALARLKEVKAAHRKASHNCYAYRIGNATRYSDDGEPHGTAGMPIYEMLRREGIDNILCVVTRYFGGTLLGRGGLVRAYTAAAKGAVGELAD